MGTLSLVLRYCVFIVEIGIASTACATAQRTFVASTGNDANPCTLTQPCRALASAVANTNDKGEILVLDSAGYGPVTINKSVSIVSPSGVYAGVSVTGGSGIEINGAGAVVRLRGLSVNGQAPTANGIVLKQGAKLSIERCELTGLDAAIYLLTAAEVDIVDTSVRGSAAGIITGGGSTTIKRSTIQGNTIGVSALTGATTIDDCLIADSTAFGVSEQSSPGLGAEVYVARSTLTRNASTFRVIGLIGSNASLVSDSNIIAYTSIVLDFAAFGGGEAVYTRGNNSIGYYLQLNPRGGTVLAIDTF